MKEKAYSYNDVDDNSIISVVLLYDGINVARGVSIRSSLDEFDENDTTAKQRAYRAIKKRKLVNNEFRDWRAIRTLIKYNAPFIVHSELNPHLSFYERKLLFGKKLHEYNRDRIGYIRGAAKFTTGTCNLSKIQALGRINRIGDGYV